MWKIFIIALQQGSQLQWTTWSFVRKGKSMTNTWYYKEWKTVRKSMTNTWHYKEWKTVRKSWVSLNLEASNKNNSFIITKEREALTTF